ncbi:hypothetical protein FH972_009514 [Carpinus fangiana]|uniref:Uncharacterized protein n=1 Tax=Carpinus fangiana TaxID=176857 RepID=A0A660KMH1_9ROSI|nr:hypothetical protein FH972_009514 [Carpinus fangiana]
MMGLGGRWGFGGRLSAAPCGRSRWCLWVVADGWLAVGSGGRCRWGPAGGVRWTTSPDFELCPWVGVADGGAGCRSLL